MLTREHLQAIANIVKVHKELHGVNNIVDYAIVNDIMRRAEFKEVEKSEVENKVKQYIKGAKNG